MFDSVISGRLIRDPKLGHTKTGKPMASVLLKVACEGADDTALVSAVAFEKAAEKLGKLGKGDAVSISGPCRLTEWESGGEVRHGIGCTAHSVMTAYTRRAKAEKPKPKPTGWEIYGDAEPFNDDLDD